MPDKPDLAALVGSRICHDLISPIGAISNGVELLLMDGNTRGPEMALISESVASANARIRYFRIGFGSASPDQRIGRGEVTAILADVFRGGRLAVEWTSPSDLSRREVKLAFLMIHCLESAMPYGGPITVDLAGDAWTLTAQSPKLRIDPALWEVLSNPDATPDAGPAQVHFLLAPEEAARQYRRITVDVGAGSVKLGF